MSINIYAFRFLNIKVVIVQQEFGLLLVWAFQGASMSSLSLAIGAQSGSSSNFTNGRTAKWKSRAHSG